MATYDREWAPTRDFAEAEYGRGMLIGEFPLWTDGGRTRRRVDGLLIRGGSTFEARQWKDLDAEGSSGYWADQLVGSGLVVIQTKLTTAGLALLGQALLSDLLIEARFRPSQLETVALATGRDADLDAILTDEPFRRLRIEVAAGFPPKRPRLEPVRDPELRRRYALEKLEGWGCSETFPLNQSQAVEAVYVRDRPPPRSLADLAGQDVVLVHSAKKAHLDLAGHAVFGAALARLARPASVSSRLVVRSDDPDLTAFLPRFQDVEVRPPGSW